MPTISVFTSDDFLYRKITLDAPSGTDIVRGVLSADIILADIDTESVPDTGCITMSRYGGADIEIPFRLGTIKQIIKKTASENAILTIDKKARSAELHGEKIKFTEVEFNLLFFLYERGGEFAEREEIIKSVWGDGVDAGILNVYIHYLREKLECRGEKIIISSRKCGYKIEKKYIGGAVCA